MVRAMKYGKRLAGSRAQLEERRADMKDKTERAGQGRAKDSDSGLALQESYNFAETMRK